jgi:hypothetical protein
MDSRDALKGVRKFREKVRQENGNKLIVFDEDLYAIFETYEIFILCGRKVQKPRGVPETITKKEDVLHKYGGIGVTPAALSLKVTYRPA